MWHVRDVAVRPACSKSSAEARGVKCRDESKLCYKIRGQGSGVLTRHVIFICMVIKRVTRYVCDRSHQLHVSQLLLLQHDPQP